MKPARLFLKDGGRVGVGGAAGQTSLKHLLRLAYYTVQVVSAGTLEIDAPVLELARSSGIFRPSGLRWLRSYRSRGG